MRISDWSSDVCSSDLPLLSLLVGLLVLRSAWLVVRESAHILLEGTPAQIDPQGLRQALLADIPALKDVHHIHAWSLTAERPLITLPAQIGRASCRERVCQYV